MNKQYKISLFFIPFIKKNLLILSLLIAVIICSVVSALLPSYALGYLIDRIVSADQQETNVVASTLLLFGSYVLVSIFTMLQNYLIDVYGQRLVHELRYEMMRKSQVMTYSYFTHHGTGEMTSRIVDDVQSIETLFSSGLISFVVSFFKIIGIMISVFLFSWPLGLCLVVIIPLIYFLTKFFRKHMLKNQMINRKKLNELSNDITETSQNIQVIHMLAKESYRQESYRKKLDSLNRSKQKTALLDSIYSPIVNLIKAVFIGVVTLLVSNGTGNGDIASLGISVGAFAASLDLISNIFAPIINLGQEMEAMQEGLSGLKRVEQFMSEPEITPKDESIQIQDILNQKKIIQAIDLCFHYDDSEELVLNHITFDIEKKDKVTVTGRTGVGKTTMFRLITGILEPTEGKLLVGGKQAAVIPNEEMKYIFGYVEQGFSSIPGTVLDQIALHDSDIDLTTVRNVMKKVFLDEYVIKNIPQGYDAPFEMNLFSRGQLQLLSLARALVFDPEILLLDEISANLDSKTEEEVIRALCDNTKDKTVISISHRLSDQMMFNKVLEVTTEGIKIHDQKKN